MLNLSKVVGQLKKERVQTQARLVQLDTAVKVLGRWNERARSQWQTQ